LSIRTTNYYARAVKGFSRWLWLEGRTPDDALRSLRLLNANASIKHARRCLTGDELQRLLDATRQSKRTVYGLKPDDRAMLYTLAAYTGLRASELASLTPESFDLRTKTVSVQAAYSKRRRNDTLPLHASLVATLTQWLATKPACIKLWRGTWLTKHKVLAARMLRKDLAAAAIAYEVGGRYADFHALRHTFVSSLARSGVHPLKAKELARHSTITLTMDVYSHVETEELRQALDTLPALNAG
jgi:integrase